MYEQENRLFDFRRSEVAPLLFVLDRRDDAVTPLLNQWTYQVMVHEVLGIADNTVDLKNLPKVPQDLQDMVKFVENYPEYRKLQHGVSKHVTLMIEMSSIVDERQLMSVSQVEQELACSTGQPAAFEAVVQHLNNEKITETDSLRLVMLHALLTENEPGVFTAIEISLTGPAIWLEIEGRGKRVYTAPATSGTNH